MKQFQRYIKNAEEVKVEMITTSVNLEKTQHDFVKEHDLNLSEITRDAVKALMQDASKEERKAK